MDEKRMYSYSVTLANDFMASIHRMHGSRSAQIKALLTMLTLFSERLAVQIKKSGNEAEIAKTETYVRDIFFTKLIPVIKAETPEEKETDLLCVGIFYELAQVAIPDIVEYFKNELLAAETRNPQRFDPKAKMTGQ
jgi:predicted transporter